MHAPIDLPAFAADILARVRDQRPRVHCITNAVAQAFTANVLLAAGAVPSMTLAVDEVAGFVAGANALLVNLGTMDPERRAAVGIAVGQGRDRGLPWVLDPVMVDRSAQRADFARGLLAAGPRVIRLNPSEFAILADTPANPEACTRFAAERSSVVALTGLVDIVAGATRRVSISNGDPLMAKVTAMGCAGSALVAACLAVEPDAFTAAAAALLLIGVAGEVAAASAQGPGSLAVGILDALDALDRATILRRARVG